MAGGEEIYQIGFLLLRFRFHDLCAVRRRRGEGEGEIGEGVRVMREKEYFDGGK